MPNSKISRIVKALNRARRIFPPLKKLALEAFLFLLLLLEIIRFLKGLF